jgi:hypothetical protein
MISIYNIEFILGGIDILYQICLLNLVFGGVILIGFSIYSIINYSAQNVIKNIGRIGTGTLAVIGGVDSILNLGERILGSGGDSGDNNDKDKDKDKSKDTKEEDKKENSESNKTDNNKK